MSQLNNKLKQKESLDKSWAIIEKLRGQMKADDSKYYIFGVMTYRYLSEKIEQITTELLKGKYLEYENHKGIIEKEIIKKIGYLIKPQYLFSAIVKKIQENGIDNFDIDLLSKAIQELIKSTIGQESEEQFEHLFDDMDLNSSSLGREKNLRSRAIANILISINEFPFFTDNINIDTSEDIFEFLIKKFAMTDSKRSSDYYTPTQVSDILAKIVSVDKKNLKNIYDPTCGSGSLLLKVGSEINVEKFYGQELSTVNFNLTRMNMLVHNVPYTDFEIKNGNTLEEPKHLGMKFDAIVANIPYSVGWRPDELFLDDERFKDYGKLAPKSKADYAFIQHMIYHLSDCGNMAVVVPHGVLFRSGAEEVIRRYLIKENNYLDAVIGLPSNMFFNTGIPVCILVFKKYRSDDEKILFIDASGEFEKDRNQNRLRDKDIEKIIETYIDRKEIEKYSQNISLEEIEQNNYNLNIPRYVDAFEEEEPIDIKVVKARLAEIDKEIKKIDEEISEYYYEIEIQ